MVTKNFTVKLKEFAEARPVAVVVQLASKFDSRIFLVSGDKKVNAKSIMGMMSLGICNDEEISVEAEGSDEEAAASEIVAYMTSMN
jgi:catabolite repression HPr-like protein